ncbi:hypothetical protein D5b_00360 [Faustovirus]|nr:hypothetical protein D5b_00360 [Faustovirus]AMN84553.1 hypothetical protein D6_00147 [Faustovirus]AMP44304.1 hypothetical protein PRJ_Dakar_00352 [Faustovirus]
MVKSANQDTKRKLDSNATGLIDLVQIQALNDLIERNTLIDQITTPQTIPELMIRRVVTLLNYIHNIGFNTTNYTFAPIYVKTSTTGVGSGLNKSNRNGGAVDTSIKPPTLKTKYSILNELKAKQKSESNDVKIIFDEVVYNQDHVGSIPKLYEIVYNGMAISSDKITDINDTVLAAGNVTTTVATARRYFQLLYAIATIRFKAENGNLVIESEDFEKFNAILDSLLSGVRAGISFGWLLNAQIAAVKRMFGEGVFDTQETPNARLKYITNGPTGDAADISKEIIGMINALSKVINVKVNTLIPTAISSDFNARGLIDFWQTRVKYGDDSTLKEVVAKYEAKMARLKYEADVINKIIQNSNLANTYMNIIEEKLGADIGDKVQAELRKKPYLMTDSNNILNLLSERQRNTVVSEYQARERLTKLLHENSCPHVKLRLSLDNETLTNRKRRLLDNLSEFFVQGKSTHGSDVGMTKGLSTHGSDVGMIKCKNCSFDIMCPHYRDLIILNTENINYKEFKIKLAEYIDKRPAANAEARSFDNTTHNYYCKICGELIGEYTAMGDFSEPSDVQDEELSGKIWGEIAFNTRFLYIDEFVSTNQLMDSIRNGIYTPIADLERNLSRSKTNTADDVKNKTKLFTTIYVFAYFIFLAANNPQITFRNFKAKNPKANPIAEMIAFVLPIILETKNIIIREIQGMTAEIIKNKLIEAFKYVLVNNKGSSIGLLEVDKLAEGFKLLVLDPLYEYAYRMNVIDMKPNVDDSGKINYAEEILGLPQLPFGEGRKRTTKTSKNNRATAVHLFGHLRIPKFALQYEKSKTSELAVMRPRTYNEYVEMMRKYRTEISARSYLMVVDKLKHSIYTNTVYSAVITEIAGVDQLTAKMNPSHSEFLAKYQPVRDLEAALSSIRWREMTFPFGGVVAKHTRNWQREYEGLASIYDENGEQHTWVAGKGASNNIYIMADNDETVEKTTKELAASIEGGKPQTLVCIDIRCGKCKKTLSESILAGTSKDDIIKSKLKERHLYADLFRYYENRCPETNSVHTYTGPEAGDECSKCGAAKNLFDFTHKESAPARDAYFAKYKDNFIRDRKSDMKILMLAEQVVEPEPTEYDLHEQELVKKYATWSQNYKRILELANEYKLNVNLINNLGHSENVDYDRLGSADYIPDDPEYKYDTRIFRIDGYITSLFRYYNRLRNNNLSDDMREIKEAIILSGSNIDAGEFSDIVGDYYTSKQYFIRSKKPRELLQFLIEQLCDKLLQISGGKYAGIKRKFVEWYIAKVFRSEEMLSKPGRFSWSILYGKTRETKENSAEVDEIDDDDEEGAATDDTPDSLFKGYQSYDMEDTDAGDDDGVELIRAEDSDV